MIQKISEPPVFTDPPRKNDAFLAYGALQELPYVAAYVQSEVEVVHGPSCKPERDVRLDVCAREGIPIHARRGGGGTVVLAPGMVVVIVVGPRHSGESIINLFSRIHDGLIAAIDPSNKFCIGKDGISDLCIGGKKILGSSLFLTAQPNFFYYQSVLMVDPDVSLLEKYLSHPPKEPAYRQGRSHGDFCTTLKAQGCQLSCEEICGMVESWFRLEC